LIEWQVARQWIVPALTEEDTETDVAVRLLEGTAQLWLGEASAMVTEVIREPRTLHVWLAGGDLAEVVSFTPGIAAWGRMMGCKSATIDGRKGWLRALKPYGFHRDGELLRKAL
jgi:hypothetical protein